MSTRAAQREGDVTVISAFGRGELLAGELKTRGFDVSLVDMTSALGERSLPDLEGPFPVVRPNPLLPAHLEWLMSHMFDEVPNGFSIWLKSGPLEFRGPMAMFYHSRDPSIAHFREHFAGWLLGGSRRQEMVKRAGELKFDDSWLIQLSHSFASTEMHRSPECFMVGDPFPINQVIQTPIFTSQTLQKVHDDAVKLGVKCMKSEGIADVRLDGNRLAEMEIQLGRVEVLRSNYFVWCLSSEETASISRKIAKTMFPRGVVKAEWAWRRFTIHSAKNSLESVIPPYVVMIEDIHFPWAYDNLIILKRRKPGLSDLWVRLPAEGSKKPDQLNKFTAKMADRLKDRFPKWSHEIEPPWDENPPLYPVFDPESLVGFSKGGLSNVLYEGAETLTRLDWAGRFQRQTESMLRLQLLKQQETAKIKEKSNDPPLHAP